MFVINGEYAYVGQSVNMEKRIAIHEKLIKRHEHPNVQSDLPINTLDFEVLCECTAGQLNESEKLYFEKYSSKYKMLNKKDCGIQGVNGDTITFSSEKSPELLYKDGYFYINEDRIARDSDGLHCLSELLSYIRDNSNYDIRPNAILNKNEFIDRINSLCHLNMMKSRDVAGQLKDAGVYKVKGARDNKKIYCTFEVFITFAFYSCPQFAASICMMIGNRILNR